MKPLLKLSLIPLLLPALTGQAELTVTNIAGGGLHNLFLKSDGSLWGMGGNAYGQLGDGSSNISANKPEQIVASGVKAIAAGSYFSLFLKSDGSLWAMGDNSVGELGDGRFISTNQPEQIAADVATISAGADYCLFLKSDGGLWAVGFNNFGQLGDGTTNSINMPEQVIASGVTAVAAGIGHSLFLKADGSLWAMGNNRSGQLGDGTTNNINIPEQIIASGVTAIAAGSDYSLFLKSDGSLWGMGGNGFGQIGDGTLPNFYTNQPIQIVAGGVAAIAAGGSHSLFLKINGSLWAMGWNMSGQLGDGTFNPTRTPEQIVASGVTVIAAGSEHSLFVKSDGSLWVMGDYGAGQLGDGFVENVFSPPYGLPVPEQIFPPPQPVLSSVVSSQTNLQFTATCGFGGNFSLLGSPDLALPLSQWTPLGTNSVTTRGANNYSVTLTNGFNPGGQQFYILQSR